MFNLEQSISAWRSQMLTVGIKSPVPLEELESHLRDEIVQQIRSGLSEAEAFQIAVHRLGGIKMLQREFGNYRRSRRLFWLHNPPALNLIAAWFIVVGINACFCLPVWLYRDSSTPQFINIIGSSTDAILCSQIIVGCGLAFRHNLWRRIALGWSGLLLTLFALNLLWTLLSGRNPLLPANSSLCISLVRGLGHWSRYVFLGLPLPMYFVNLISFMNIAVLLSACRLLTRPSIRALFPPRHKNKMA